MSHDVLVMFLSTKMLTKSWKVGVSWVNPLVLVTLETWISSWCFSYVPVINTVLWMSKGCLSWHKCRISKNSFCSKHECCPRNVLVMPLSPQKCWVSVEEWASVGETNSTVWPSDKLFRKPNTRMTKNRHSWWQKWRWRWRRRRADVDDDDDDYDDDDDDDDDDNNDDYDFLIIKEKKGYKPTLILSEGKFVGW